jgi:hypothetical protein
MDLTTEAITTDGQNPLLDAFQHVVVAVTTATVTSLTPRAAPCRTGSATPLVSCPAGR